MGSENQKQTKKKTQFIHTKIRSNSNTTLKIVIKSQEEDKGREKDLQEQVKNN